MPSIAAHMAVCNTVSKQLNIDNNEFIKGNILPDIIDMNDSHKKIECNNYLIPDLSYFKNNYDLSNMLYLGYYVHLLLDKYFLDYFLKNSSNLNAFIDKTIYNEYTTINYKIINEFELDVTKLKEVLVDFSVDIKDDVLDHNLQCLSSTTMGDTTYLNFDDFSKFLYDISIVISEEIKNYASKSN